MVDFIENDAVFSQNVPYHTNFVAFKGRVGSTKYLLWKLCYTFRSLKNYPKQKKKVGKAIEVPL